MFELLGNLAQSLVQQNKTRPGAKANPSAPRPEQQGLYARIGVNRGIRSLPEYYGWELSDPMQVLLAVAMTVFGRQQANGNTRNNSPDHSYLWSIYSSSDKPDLRIPKRNVVTPNPAGDAISPIPGEDEVVARLQEIGSVFLIHATTSVGLDPLGLAGSIGKAALAASVLGEHGVGIQMALPTRKWQENNHSARTILAQDYTLYGQPITLRDIGSGIDQSLIYRRRFYESGGMHVRVHGPGDTVDEAALSALVAELTELSHSLVGQVLTEAQRQDQRIAFLEHLDKTAGGRTDNKMRSVDSVRIYYYALQAFVVGDYLNKEKLIFRLGPPSEISFDHEIELNPDGKYPSLPRTSGPFPRCYHPHRCIGSNAMLDYHWFSIGIKEAAKRRGRRADLTELMMSTIPLGKTDQTVGEIAALLQATPLMPLNQLFADLTGALLLWSRRAESKNTLHDACVATGLREGPEELFNQLGGRQLVEGWLEATELPPGKATRERLLNWFNAFDPRSGLPQGPTPPHWWFALQSRWSDSQYLLLAQLVDVVRKYYQMVTST